MAEIATMFPCEVIEEGLRNAKKIYVLTRLWDNTFYYLDITDARNQIIYEMEKIDAEEPDLEIYAKMNGSDIVLGRWRSNFIGDENE